MKNTRLARAVFIACSILFVVALVLLFSHRSDAPVILGRYSRPLIGMIVTLISVYGAVAYLYLYGVESFGRAYLFIAGNVLSFVLLIVGVNVVAQVMTFFTGSALTSTSDSATVQRQETVHAELIGMNRSDFLAFRTEQGRPKNWQYEPWVGFRETPRQGRFINVSAEGFRKTTAAPDNPEHWLFLLGGSTTFGYGVTDDQTIASYLQARLAEVYGEKKFGVKNFGRAYYYSAQELLLLWTLLDSGLKPSVVVFIDGDNEPQTSPYYFNEMRVMFDRYQEEFVGKVDVGRLLADLAVQAPVYPYLRRLYLERLARSGEAPRTAHPLERLRPGTTPTDIAGQYEATNEIIRFLCTRHGIQPFFAVQPMPGYRNEFRTHVFLPEPLDRFSTDVLALLESSTRQRPDRLDLTGLLAGFPKQPFVDRLHYSPEVHRLIARAIADQIAGSLDALARPTKTAK